MATDRGGGRFSIWLVLGTVLLAVLTGIGTGMGTRLWDWASGSVPPIRQDPPTKAQTQGEPATDPAGQPDTVVQKPQPETRSSNDEPTQAPGTEPQPDTSNAEEPDPDADAPPLAGRQIQLTANTTCYAEPNTFSAVIVRLRAGQVLRVRQRLSGRPWFEVECAAQSGFVQVTRARLLP